MPSTDLKSENYGLIKFYETVLVKVLNEIQVPALKENDVLLTFGWSHFSHQNLENCACLGLNHG